MTEGIKKNPNDLLMLRHALGPAAMDNPQVSVSPVPLTEIDLEKYLDNMIDQYRRACGERPLPDTPAGARFSEVMARFFAEGDSWTIGTASPGMNEKDSSFFEFLIKGNCPKCSPARRRPDLIDALNEIKAQILRSAVLNGGEWKKVMAAFGLSSYNDSAGLQNRLVFRLAKIQEALKEKVEEEKLPTFESLLHVLRDPGCFLMGYKILNLLEINDAGELVFPASFEALVESAKNNAEKFDLLYEFAIKKQDKENGGGKNGAGGTGTPPEGAPPVHSCPNITSAAPIQPGALIFLGTAIKPIGSSTMPLNIMLSRCPI
jgi:hypothetical protein